MEPNVATDPSLHPRTELPVDAVVVWNFREVRPRALEVPLESDGSDIEVPLETDGSDIGSRPSLEELQLKGARGFHIGHQITGN